jgi:hypothetical protein
VRLDDLIAAVSGVETVKDCVFDEISTNGETLLHLLCRSYQNDKAPVVKQLLFHSANPDVQVRPAPL